MSWTPMVSHCAVFAGQIKADGGDQQKFDDGMRAMRKEGKQVWPSPDVMEKMGAKDALCKADLEIKCLKHCSEGWWITEIDHTGSINAFTFELFLASGRDHEHWPGGYLGILLSRRVQCWLQEDHGVPTTCHQAEPRLLRWGHLDHQAEGWEARHVKPYRKSSMDSMY